MINMFEIIQLHIGQVPRNLKKKKKKKIQLHILPFPTQHKLLDST